jgi:hypothetical protein
MRTSHILSAVILAVPCISVLHGRALAGEVRAGKKPRVIATTDGEGDDRCSMVRFLVYANESRPLLSFDEVSAGDRGILEVVKSAFSLMVGIFCLILRGKDETNET